MKEHPGKEIEAFLNRVGFGVEYIPKFSENEGTDPQGLSTKASSISYSWWRSLKD